MTLVANQLETLDYVTANSVPTGAGAAETQILATDVINASTYYGSVQTAGQSGTPQSTRPVVVEANMNITPGTGTTSVVVRCRQGVGTGGTQVGLLQAVTLAAGASAQCHFKFRDSSGPPFSAAGTAYTITLAQTAGTAAGTVNIDIEVKQ